MASSHLAEQSPAQLVGSSIEPTPIGGRTRCPAEGLHAKRSDSSLYSLHSCLSPQRVETVTNYIHHSDRTNTRSYDGPDSDVSSRNAAAGHDGAADYHDSGPAGRLA